MKNENATEVVETLSKTERRRLSELESTITEGMRWYEQAGQALTEIKESKLYRETHGTFAEYLKEKWEVSARRAYQIMDAATAAENVKKITHLEIPNESVAREFSKLPEKIQVRVAKKLVKSKEILTAKSVEIVAQKLTMAPRGGLYASSMAAKQKTKSSSSSESHSRNGNGNNGNGKHRHKPCQKCREAIISEIDEWYLENRTTLNEYPVTIPEQVIKKLIKALTI